MISQSQFYLSEIITLGNHFAGETIKIPERERPTIAEWNGLWKRPTKA